MGDSSTVLYMRLQLRHLLELESSESLTGLEDLLPESVAWLLAGSFNSSSHGPVKRAAHNIAQYGIFPRGDDSRENKSGMERGAKT